MVVDGEPRLQCVECSARVSAVLHEVGSDVVLAKCEACGAIADKYMEYEALLIIIDMLLHRHGAYRHVLSNRLQTVSAREQRRALLGAIALYLFCDVSRKCTTAEALVRHLLPGGAAHPAALPSPLVLRLSYAWWLFSSTVEFAVFAAVATRVAEAVVGHAEPGHVLTALTESSRAGAPQGAAPTPAPSPARAPTMPKPSLARRSWTLGAVLLLSSASKSLLVLHMIWQYPLAFGAVVEGFTLSCNLVAMTVALQCTTTQAAAILALAAGARACFTLVLLLLPIAAMLGTG